MNASFALVLYVGIVIAGYSSQEQCDAAKEMARQSTSNGVGVGYCVPMPTGGYIVLRQSVTP